MGNLLRICLLSLTVLASAGGCRMCADCDLDSYAAYGGRWHRTDRDHGRVGSLFKPAGAQVPYDTSVMDQPTAENEQDDSTPTPVEPLEPLEELAPPELPMEDSESIEELETALLDRLLEEDF